MLHYAASSHVGCVRDHNEDYFLSRPDCGLWVLADGMGGHEAGEVASRIVCSAIVDAVVGGMALPAAVQAAHHAVLNAARSGQGALGMGSTVVAMQIKAGICEITWVGDSRAYLWDGSQLRQLTRDHSLVQHLVDTGAITEAEALQHPHRNVILQSMGSPQLVDVNVGVVSSPLRAGQCIMLCSDGLNGEVPDHELAAILRQAALPTQALHPLIESAKRHGGNDNITVILVAELTDAQALQIRSTDPIGISAIHDLHRDAD